MRSTLTITVILCLVAPGLSAQNLSHQESAIDRKSVSTILGFEEQSGGSLPLGWSGSPAITISPDQAIVHSGRWSERFTRDDTSSGKFSTLTASLPVDFTGKEIQLRGFLRTEEVHGYASLWLREDGESSVLKFTDMQKENLGGTTPWTEYNVTLPIDADAQTIAFGALLEGTGVAWVDDLQILVDGKPIAEATAANKQDSVLTRDHQFDSGSGTVLQSLSQAQIDNLALLGRVWGFLKYHHSAVTSGGLHWDYELLRILPVVLSAPTPGVAQNVIVHWIDGLGAIPPCNPCTRLEGENLNLKPDVSWLGDRKLLGIALSSRLENTYANRHGAKQFYVSTTPIANPQFEHELVYGRVHYPDAGFQLLALFRFWNIIEYWSPDREIAQQNWPEVLRAFIPRVALARDAESYELALMAFAAEMNDSHTNLWSSIRLRPPTGDCQLLADIRFIEGHAVVVNAITRGVAGTNELRRGDVIEELDGVPVAQLLTKWRPFYGASNEAAWLRDSAESLTRGSCGPGSFLLQRNNNHIVSTLERVKATTLTESSETHDLPGATFRLLTKDVAYLKLSSVKASDIPSYMEQAKGTAGLVIDLRGYPSEFVVFALGKFLVSRPTPFVQFSIPDLSNPGAFKWGPSVALQPGPKHYGGKIVILVDETTQSQAEYTTMAFQSVPNAIVVGSTTAGADGNVSRVSLPGNLGSLISGLGVYYPDRGPTQRVGVRIDVSARPTLAGIAAGRDEVLETGMKQIIGQAAAADVAEKLIQHP